MDDLSILRKAILNEVEGKAFYELAAANSSNEEVKEALLYLREQEADHEQWLRSLLEKILQNKHFDLEYGTWLELQFLKQQEREKRENSPEIFAKAAEKFKLAENDLAVLAAAALMEKAAIEFYSEAIQRSATQEIKVLCEKLAKWEEDHLKTLQEMHDQLSRIWMDDYEFFSSPEL